MTSKVNNGTVGSSGGDVDGGPAPAGTGTDIAGDSSLSSLVLREDILALLDAAGAHLTTAGGVSAVLETVDGKITVPISQQTISDNNKKMHQQVANATAKFLVVGRQASTSDLRIQHKSLSRQHAILYYGKNNNNSTSGDGNHLFLVDLGGKHGTSVNCVRLTAHAPHALEPGDVIRFGNVNRESYFTVRFQNDNDAPVRSENQQRQQQDSEAEAIEEEATILEQEVESGKTLSGRAKREAELMAMMASLDQTPTYQKYHPTSSTGKDTEEQQSNINTLQNDPAMKATQRFQLPLSTRYHISASAGSGDRTKPLPVTCLAVDPTGSRFAVGSRDRQVRLYNFSGMDQVRREPYQTVIPESGHPIVDLSFSNTGDRFLVGTGSAQPLVMSREGEPLLQFVRGDMYVSDMTKTMGHAAAVTAVAWHPLERHLVLTASHDGTARLWNIETGRLQFEKLTCDKVYVAKSARGQKTPVTSLAFHPGGREFALGTACGSLQIWLLSRTNRPQRVVQTAVDGKNNMTISSLSYSHDGKWLASRCFEENKAHVWSMQPHLSSAPICSCLGLPTLHEQANFVLSPDGKWACGGATAMVPNHEVAGAGAGADADADADAGGMTMKERGSLNFYQILNSDVNNNKGNFPARSETTMTVSPIVALETTAAGGTAGPIVVQWHRQLNQVLVGCSDGSVTVYSDPMLSRNGALLALNKAGKVADSLSVLLQSRQPVGLAALQGAEVLAPFATGARKRKFRKGDEPPPPDKLREPERPASGKHKAGGLGSGTTTLQQFIVDQQTTMRQQKTIAGCDPREALLRHAKPEHEADKNRVLATQTVEQMEEEMKQQKAS